MRFAAKIFLGAMFVVAGVISNIGNAGSAEQYWTDRVIPLPKEVKVSGAVKLSADKVKIDNRLKDPANAGITAAWLLDSQFGGDTPEKPELTVTLCLAKEAGNLVPEALKSRLAKLPNANQAYAIVSDKNAKRIVLTGNTPVGVLYAARTFLQITGAGYRASIPVPIREYTVPWVNIVDWPDIAQRGTWVMGKDYLYNLEWMSRWKLNFVEHCAGCKLDNAYAPKYGMLKTNKPIINTPKLQIQKLRAASYLGVSIEYAIGHLEQQARYWGHGLLNARRDPNLKEWKPALAVQNPELRFDPNKGGLSMSNPKTLELITIWMTKIAEISKGFNDTICVWFSEGAPYCHADKQKLMKEKGFYDPFLCEVETCVKAFEQVKKKFPNLKLRFLLTQGTRTAKSRERILKALPEGVGIYYYDGHLTYSSDKKPMIFPALADFAAKGGIVGVLPQVIHCCGVIVPWSGLPMIRFRCNEFFDKKLQNVFVFFEPDMVYCRINLMALAEWTWNTKGRTEADFARAYATVYRICDPKLYAKWAVLSGEAGWVLAEGKFFVRLFHNPSQGLFSGQEFGKQYKNFEINDPKKLEKAISQARESLLLARQAKVPAMIFESEFVTSALEAYALLKDISKLIRTEKLSAHQKQQLANKMNKLDKCAHLIEVSLKEWSAMMESRRYAAGLPPTHMMWLGRLHGACTSMLRTADAVRIAAASKMIPDPRPESRSNEVGEYNLKGNETSKLLKFNVTKQIPPEGGKYYVFFNGKFLSVKTISVVAANPDGSGRKVLVKTAGHLLTPLEIPCFSPGKKVTLEANIRPSNRNKALGTVNLRRVWHRGDFPQYSNRKLETGKAANTKAMPKLCPAKSSEITVGVTEGWGTENLLDHLNKVSGCKAFKLNSLSPENLNRCKVIIIPQCNAPARMTKYLPYLREWVKNGGGVIFTHDAGGFRKHPAIFKEIGAGFDHPKAAKVKVVKNHPVTASLKTGSLFSPGYDYDHVVFKTGPNGIAVIASTSGSPVTVVGEYGKGKVVLDGMLTGVTCKPGTCAIIDKKDIAKNNPEEFRLLDNCIKWCAGSGKNVSAKSPVEVDKGPNLAQNPGAEKLVPKKQYGKFTNLAKGDDMLPPGWGVYVGDGIGAWGVSEENPHGGKNCVYIKYVKPRKPGGIGAMGVTLPEYSGLTGIPCKPNTDYEISFWVRGDVPMIKVSTLMHSKSGKNKPGCPEIVRVNGRLIPKARFGIPISEQWQQVTARVQTYHDTDRFIVLIMFANPVDTKPGQQIYVDDAIIKPIAEK